MFADVLNAPVAELPMSDNINAGKYLVDACTLISVISVIHI